MLQTRVPPKIECTEATAVELCEPGLVVEPHRRSAPLAMNPLVIIVTSDGKVSMPPRDPKPSKWMKAGDFLGSQFEPVLRAQSPGRGSGLGREAGTQPDESSDVVSGAVGGLETWLTGVLSEVHGLQNANAGD